MSLADYQQRSGYWAQPEESLPPEQRAARYRQMGNEALRKAQYLKSGAEKTECLRLAWAWHAKAQEIESDVKRLTQLEGSEERLRKTTPQDRS